MSVGPRHQITATVVAAVAAIIMAGVLVAGQAGDPSRRSAGTW